MANWYVRSGATGSATGTSWANASLTLAAGLALAAAADSVWVSEDHAETQASAMSITSPATSAGTMTRITCVNHSGSVPPVSADLRTTATIQTSGTNDTITFSGYFYCYGIAFGAGASTSGQVNIQTNNTESIQIFDSCSLTLLTTGNSSKIIVGTGTSSQGNACVWLNTTVGFRAASQTIAPGGGSLTWKNTPSAVTGTVPTGLFMGNSANGRTAVVVLDGIDLSAVNTTLVASATICQIYQITNCLLNSGVTVAATPAGPADTLIDCIISDSGATGYRQERYRYQGTLTTETTVIRSLGANDSVTGISWKIITTSGNLRQSPFECFQIGKWYPLVGASRTVSVEVINDGTTLTNADIWMDIEYLGSALTPLASLATSGPADILAAGTNLTSSSASWTTTGLTTPIAQTLSTTLTPQMAGFVRVTVKVAKTSKTIWVDPLVTIV